nr:MAG TPA: hypothetical protein [Caudoviricetes sp.]
MIFADPPFHGVPMLNGFRIVVNTTCDDVPKMTVSSRFAELMPAGFVADLNAWMREFFGTENVMYRLGDHTVVMGPKSIALFRESAEIARGPA